MRLAANVAWLFAISLAAFAQTSEPSWINKSDKDFAADYAEMAFEGNLKDRQRLAWMIFTRVNQLVDDPTKGGMSGSGKVPVWLAWATDPDTFNTIKPFDFNAPPRDNMRPSIKKKNILAGRVTTADPNQANEEVTRNKISYDYLIKNGLTTKLDVAAFFTDNDYVDMPVGSIELKASWLQVTKGSPAPPGALTYIFDSGEYWFRGLHIQVKMKSLSDPGNVFYTEEPSWFWSTFDFNNNPGVMHVRETLITQRAPLSKNEISDILALGDLAGFGFEAYAPNGTQIRFTENGNGSKAIILGNTDMEDFAGSPNTAQPAYWRHLEASCHSCHATASYNPETKAFFPFSVPIGVLHPGYNMTDSDGAVRYLGQGYRPLDFMWPIAFQAR
ncbi:MAG: hypothetical protein P8R04_03170 [Gammaproteobacteria bacterium]|nr:hypothetical protein [Gammaproteobacteria bacterium]